MKKLLACSVILLVALLFAGCDLFSQSTSGPVMTFVNGSETETIEELEVRVYLGVDSRSEPPLQDALGSTVTLGSGEEVTVTLPNAIAEEAALKVSVRISGANSEVYIDGYDADFTLTFNGTTEPNKFTVTAGEAEIQL